ncbi:MAG: hypothetical protein AB7N54_13385 [Alphaproteobacteria bacterium]
MTKVSRGNAIGARTNRRPVVLMPSANIGQEMVRTIALSSSTQSAMPAATFGRFKKWSTSDTKFIM